VDDGDCEKGADGGGAGSASVEAEHEIRRGSFGYVVLAVRRRAARSWCWRRRVDSGQNDMRGRCANEIGLGWRYLVIHELFLIRDARRILKLRVSVTDFAGTRLLWKGSREEICENQSSFSRNISAAWIRAA
jgi:hypothetical protein